jgi:hypothetical protein
MSILGGAQKASVNTAVVVRMEDGRETYGT